jgi:uncharacterized protein (TIGR02996 family)
MSEDEAFIRAIVDSPGDETPRLVYADWLEERGDPRGRYLRAEQEAYTTGDIAKALSLAVGLDPLWVARVTPPPFGVCCEHLHIRNRGPVLNSADIEQFEREFKFTLPSDYRAFLLNYNGGVAGTTFYETPEGEQFYPLEYRFFSLKGPSEDAEQNGLERSVSSRSRYLAECFSPDPPDPAVERWFLRCITVGLTPDEQSGVLLGIAGGVFGRVLLFDYNAGLYPGVLQFVGGFVATSFAEFLSTLPNTGYP